MGIASPLPTVHASHASPHRARSKARSPDLDETHGPSAAHATPLHTAFAHEHPRKHPTRSWRWSGRRNLLGSTRELLDYHLLLVVVYVVVFQVHVVDCFQIRPPEELLL